MPSATGTDTAKYILWTSTDTSVRYFDIYRRADTLTASITTADIVSKVGFGTNHFVDVRPNSPEWYWIKAISWAGKSSAFSDTITALTSVSLTGEPTGFPNRTSSVLTWTNGTRTLSISPAATAFNYYIGGVKATLTAAATVQLPNTSALSYIYFNDSVGTLVSTSGFTNEQLSTLIISKPLVAAVYYNTAGTTTYYADERHGIQMSGSVHSYEHFTEGYILFSGATLNTITADQTGADNFDAQFGIDEGNCYDEDIGHVCSAVLSTTGCEIWYRTGANGDWVSTTNAGYSFLVGVTPLLQYNAFGGGVWSLAEVTNNQFACVHVFATNQVTNQYVSIVGQTDYATLNQAREGAGTEIASLATGGLPDKEYVPVATVILQTSGAYGNAMKTRVRSYSSTEDYVDWRFTAISPGAGPTDHGSLSGLADDDHNQYLNINGRGGQVIDDALQISGAVTINNTLEVSGSTTLHSFLTVAAWMTVSGATTLNGLLNVAGATTIDGATILKSTLAVSGATTLNGLLNVSGATTIDGATILKSTLAVSGAVTINNSLTINGSLSVSAWSSFGPGASPSETNVVDVHVQKTNTGILYGIYATPTYSPIAPASPIQVGFGGFCGIGNTNKRGYAAGLTFGPYNAVAATTGSTATETILVGTETWGARGFTGTMRATDIIGLRVRACWDDGLMTLFNASAATGIMIESNATVLECTNEILLHIKTAGEGSSVAAQVLLDGACSAGDSVGGHGIWFGGTSTADGGIHIGKSQTNGAFFISRMTAFTSGEDAIHWDTATRTLVNNSSTRELKNNIRTYNNDWMKLLKITPSAWNDKGNNKEGRGWIAEELEEIGMKELVRYSAKTGKIKGIKTTHLPMYILEIMKVQQGQINELREKINGLELKKD